MEATRSVFARYVPVSQVSVHDIRQMYAVFIQYYENVEMTTFLSDLSRKTGVFLIRRRGDRRIVGFSTMQSLMLPINGRTVRCVFSGDTIIEREYWGSRVLQAKFYLRMIREKLGNPFQPLYWLLISKGYKTYLLLANNFYHYYPDPGGRYQHLRGVVDQYCDRLFPDYFDRDRGLLDFGDGYQFLRAEVADITPELRQSQPKIEFFEQVNPTWRRGTELPCVGQINLSCLARFAFRFLRKLVAGRRQQWVGQSA